MRLFSSKPYTLNPKLCLTIQLCIIRSEFKDHRTLNCTQTSKNNLKNEPPRTTDRQNWQQGDGTWCLRMSRRWQRESTRPRETPNPTGSIGEIATSSDATTYGHSYQVWPLFHIIDIKCHMSQLVRISRCRCEQGVHISTLKIRT